MKKKNLNENKLLLECIKMHNIDIKSKIFNPNIETTITVPQFDTVAEAVKMMGKKYVLLILNRHAILTSRACWNKRIIDELYKK